ncbi:hypothetical protein JCM11251_006225 [Rhodosporidiobolus azoricus]
MRSVLALATLASFSTFAAAQVTGYGRFPCTIVNGDGTLSPDQTQCADANLIVPGTGTGTPDVDAQGDLPPATGAVCAQIIETQGYFCGIAGAACQTDANCDNGACVAGTCQGGYTQGCATDTDCSGFLYCLNPDFGTASNQCGGIGAFCQDYTQGDPTLTPAENQPIFNQFCASGYCNAGTGACDTLSGLGDDCSSDPEFNCATGLYCREPDFTCQVLAAPSGGARQRRNLASHKRSLCPASHSACSVPGSSKGFECIDTSSNIEQCGACATSGGVDCSSLPGVEAVGCVAGVCEIWSCADGHQYDAEAGACVAAVGF